MYDKLLKTYSKFKKDDIVYFVDFNLKISKAKIVSVEFLVTENEIKPQYQVQKITNILMELDEHVYVDNGHNLFLSIEELRKETIKNLFGGEWV